MKARVHNTSVRAAMRRPFLGAKSGWKKRLGDRPLTILLNLFFLILVLSNYHYCLILFYLLHDVRRYVVRGVF